MNERSVNIMLRMTITACLLWVGTIVPRVATAQYRDENAWIDANFNYDTGYWQFVCKYRAVIVDDGNTVLWFRGGIDADTDHELGRLELHAGENFIVCDFPLPVTTLGYHTATFIVMDGRKTPYGNVDWHMPFRWILTNWINIWSQELGGAEYGVY